MSIIREHNDKGRVHGRGRDERLIFAQMPCLMKL
ncbi:hypothetical protein BDA96_07G110000 [Sorghum bicolor]|uniref:Uncharacterized protein n=1 Tax=Sorghum bicolor TaxID=4558 RepID=A0A921QMQ0_SORBI|nr:hypothetical protein BDA96_07G110000 [Sorghum bicolor]